MRKDYTTISVPVSFYKEIDNFIKENPELGYSSYADFIKEAVRIHMIFVSQRKNLDVR